MDYVKIGQRIKAIREERKLTLRDVEKRVSLTNSYLSKIERGEKKPNLEVLSEIAKALGVEVLEFLDETHPIPAELKEIGVKWINFASEMENKNITPDELRAIVSILNKNTDKI